MACSACCSFCKFDECICKPFWKHFDNEIKAVRSLYEKSDIRQNVQVSTITVNVIIPYVSIDFKQLCKYFEPTVTFSEISNNSKNKKSKNNKLINNNIYNTCVLKGYHRSYEGNKTITTKVTCKLFHNGSINITGCKSMKQIVGYLHMLYEFLISIPNIFVHRNVMEFHNISKIEVYHKKIKRDADSITVCDKNIKRIRIGCQDRLIKTKYARIEILFEDNTTKYITDFYDFKCDGKLVSLGKIPNIHFRNARISMVNSDLKINFGMKLSKTFLLFNDSAYKIENGGHIKQIENSREKGKHNISVSYVPDTEADTVITRERIRRYSGEITIVIYQSGSISFFSGELHHIRNIIRAYKFVMELLFKNKVSIVNEFASLPVHQNKKEKYSIHEIQKNVIKKKKSIAFKKQLDVWCRYKCNNLTDMCIEYLEHQNVIQQQKDIDEKLIIYVGVYFFMCTLNNVQIDTPLFIQFCNRKNVRITKKKLLEVRELLLGNYTEKKSFKQFMDNIIKT